MQQSANVGDKNISVVSTLPSFGTLPFQNVQSTKPKSLPKRANT